MTPNALENSSHGTVFGHVLSMPVFCPACHEPWILLVDVPVALEIEMGLAGKRHISLLAQALIEECKTTKNVQHFRTDGKTVWCPEQTEASYTGSTSK